VEDVDGDGKDEIVTTWEGAIWKSSSPRRGADHAYRPVFQNAGRQVEKRYDPAGLAEFWITSRTYDEGRASLRPTRRRCTTSRRQVRRGDQEISRRAPVLP